MRQKVWRQHFPQRVLALELMAGPRPLLWLASALSLLAALIHLSAAPDHFEDWWGYGAFFLIVAGIQGAYGVALLCRVSQSLLLLGIGGNLALIFFYIITRTAGVPFLGPHAGEVEPIGAIDLACKVAEFALIITLLTLARSAKGPRSQLI